MGVPPPARRARNNVNLSSDSILDSQLKESFTILYGLVFELRQGMEDLQFRLQIMDGKISTLLKILSSFQDAFPSNPVGEASTEEPHVETGEGNAQTQCLVENVVEQVEHEDTATGQHVLQDTSPVANRDERNVDADMQLESKGTLVEEEP
jgi:hypothetical protein